MKEIGHIDAQQEHLIGTTPYSVMFSHGGDRLAVGRGSYYGMGGIQLYDVSSGSVFRTSFKDIPEFQSEYVSLTASGVCFSADDEHLGVTTFSSSHHLGPTVYFRAEGLRVIYENHITPQVPESLGDSTPTGGLFARGSFLTRSNTSAVRGVITRFEAPKRYRMDDSPKAQHLTHHRLVVLRDGSVLTGGGGFIGIGGWSPGKGTFELGKACDGLVKASIDHPDEPSIVPVATKRATALSLAADGRSVLVGGLAGEILRLLPERDWSHAVLRQAKGKETPKELKDFAWATYRPASVVAICHTCQPDEWLAIDAAGELIRGMGDEVVESWQLPTSGSPRSIAAHPSLPLAAIALKQDRREKSVVVLVDLES